VLRKGLEGGERRGVGKYGVGHFSDVVGPIECSISSTGG